MRTICASSVSEPTRCASITSVPVPLTVPPVTLSPGAFSTGIGSPVTIDSSMLRCALDDAAIDGIRSPGRTRSRSSTYTSASGTSRSVPSASIRRAVFGARPSRLRIAALVRLRARSSSTWPSSTRTTIAAAGSKYTATAPPMRNECGKRSGASVATTLKPYAAPTPSAMSVNMLRWRLTSDAHPRTKNGQPPHSTTGVASASSIQFNSRASMRA